MNNPPASLPIRTQHPPLILGLLILIGIGVFGLQPRSGQPDRPLVGFDAYYHPDHAIKLAGTVDCSAIPDLPPVGTEAYHSILDRVHEAVAREPGNAEYLFMRGTLLACSGELDAAIADFDQLVAVYPTYAEAYFYRALLYTRLGQDRQAVADYSKD